ncbi:TIGR02391 family protein [Actinomyces howellii]|uniref:Protein of uncharacterized function (Hypoth_ymh) n=1 Tax=Actinomyces howellii TaxID=52771 RepID=A0A3S4QZ84_9ACTO|nr:TIGR02391 family protein [Actinomyces howellii]VEG25790.1 Protein of uncharacterised function (Hypoth_ymh) [Actinomyces howellii]
MKAECAINELEALKAEAAAPGFADSGDVVDAWRGKVRAVLTAVVGEQDHLVAEHDAIEYTPKWSVAGDRTAFLQAKKRGVDRCCSNIDAAIYQFSLIYKNETQLPAAADYDPDLWVRVSSLVEREEWDKVPAEVAIFFEDLIRKWAGNPTEKNGSTMVGQSLMGQAFGNDGRLRLGGQSNETQGWRNLAVGFTQAVSNVVRHNTVERHDARQYAIGVLGLASLILTQVRYEHNDLLSGV